MQTKEIWAHIHAERATMVTTLGDLTSEQWSSPSGSQGWTVQQCAGHILAAAEQTFPNFYRELASAGMKFHVFTTRGATRLGSLPTEEIVGRLDARTATTNRPPAPVLAMLGEIVVHGDDIRRPLGLAHRSPEAALVAVAEAWKKSNLLIGAKRRIAGLRLRADDADWSHGDGPEVVGPLQSLVVAMTGRKAAHRDLTGEGLTILAGRP